MPRLRLIAVTAGILAALVCAAPAGAAFTPPELFVRAQTWDTHEPAGDWLPLASAPVLEYTGGYQVGFRMQASGEPANRQSVALTVAGVPDGQPSQPYNATPYRGSFDATSAPVTSRKGYYLGRFAFGGTRFLRASRDPAPMALSATKRSFGYARRFLCCT